MGDERVRVGDERARVGDKVGMAVELRKIDEENWRECLRLRLRPEQERFVATNAYSLCQARYEEGWLPLAIYEGDRMVGFVMFSDTRHLEWGYWIVRVMIDKTHQGRGLGRAAVQTVISQLQTREDCDEIYLSYEPDNTVAENLYTSLGFEKTGDVFEGELVAKLKLDRQDDPPA